MGIFSTQHQTIDNQGMDLNDWLKVANSAGAIGETIDRRRQQQRTNTEEDRQKTLNDQAAQAFNYFFKNPEAMDFDNSDKQTRQQSALGDVAGIPEERPRMPIEGFSPEAIAKARQASMVYWANKKRLSNANLEQTTLKAKQDDAAFKKGISRSMTLLASGDEKTAKQIFADTYNKYYQDGYKVTIGPEGNVIMASPFGDQNDLGQVDFEKLLNEIAASPNINPKSQAIAASNTQAARIKANDEAQNNPQYLYSADGKEYYQYVQWDKKNNDRVLIVMDKPWGSPDAKSLTSKEIKTAGLQTKSAIKHQQGKEAHTSKMENDKATRNKKSGKGATDTAAGDKRYLKHRDTVRGSNEFYGATEEEISAEALKRTQGDFSWYEGPEGVETENSFTNPPSMDWLSDPSPDANDPHAAAINQPGGAVGAVGAVGGDSQPATSSGKVLTPELAAQFLDKYGDRRKAEEAAKAEGYTW